MKLLGSMLAVTTVLISSVSAQADETCPSPTVQVTQDIKAKLDGDLSTLLKFGTIKGAGEVEKVEHDVLHQYPNADRAALQQNTLSLLCSKILPSPDYSQDFKQKLMEKLVTAITSPNPNPDATASSTHVEVGSCGVGAGRDASGNTVNCGTVPSTPKPKTTP
jgi:hypothetical protein